MSVATHEPPTGKKLCRLPITIRTISTKDARDLKAVCEIEDLSFKNPWSMDDFRKCLKQKNRYLFVAIAAKQIVGFIVIEATPKCLLVLNFTVHPDCRKRGVGSQIIAWLIEQLSATKRSRILMEVRETNLPMQLFLRSVGLKACQVMRGYYEDTDEDAYQFDYLLNSRL